jgi:hypothetical protein
MFCGKILVRDQKELILERKMLSLVLLASFIAAVYSYTDEALADQITNLPGAENLKLNFNQFSGYLSVPGTTGANTKHLHYW